MSLQFSQGADHCPDRETLAKFFADRLFGGPAVNVVSVAEVGKQVLIDTFRCRTQGRIVQNTRWHLDETVFAIGAGDSAVHSQSLGQLTLFFWRRLSLPG